MAGSSINGISISPTSIINESTNTVNLLDQIKITYGSNFFCLIYSIVLIGFLFWFPKLLGVKLDSSDVKVSHGFGIISIIALVIQATFYFFKLMDISFVFFLICVSIIVITLGYMSFSLLKELPWVKNIILKSTKDKIKEDMDDEKNTIIIMKQIERNKVVSVKEIEKWMIRK